MAPETQIGKVAALTGQATARSAQGEVRPLNDDAPVFQDDVITTQADSTLELIFEDGTVFAQGADSEIMLDVYVYDADAGSAELLFNLAKGSIRAVSGEIAKLNPEGFNVETPLSTVGIRGTGFFVILTPDGQVVGVESMDPTHVVVVETLMGQVTIARAGDYIAVQLDGFLSDPAMFSPEFLEGVQNLAPLQGEPPTDTQLPGQEGDGEGQDIPQEVLDELTEILQQLQALGDDPTLLGAAGEAGENLGLNGDLTDTLEELEEIIAGLEQTLSGASNAITNLAEDILSGNIPIAQALGTVDFSTFASGTDGSAQLAQLQSAGYNAIEGDGAANTLNGTTGKDAILGHAANDTISGTSADDALFGGSGTDTLYGNHGNDSIFGGADADNIHGNEGADYLVGGGGEDKFYYTTLLEGGDTIRDFVPGGTAGSDRIYLKDTGTAFNFGGNIVHETVAGFSTGTVGTNAFTTLVYDSTSGKLYYDTDATNGLVGAVYIADFEGNPSLSQVDITLF